MSEEVLSLRRSRDEQSSVVQTSCEFTSYTGKVYFGPAMIKHGRRLEKRWWTLCTCHTARAIHIELAFSLSTNSLILLLIVIYRQVGTPNWNFCYNGTNIHEAEHKLQKVTAENYRNAIEENYKSIKWRFNPPSTPHIGGACEQLIRSVKFALGCSKHKWVLFDDLDPLGMWDAHESQPLTYV